MTQVVTLTINPALDLSTSVKKMAPFSKLRCALPHRDPGGGGINVARVLKRLGDDVTAVFPAGGANGQSLARLIEAEGVRSLAVPALNDTREDITVFDEATSQQYRFVMPGAALSEFEWQQCLEAAVGLAPAPRFAIASGSLPDGVPDDYYGRFARIARQAGSKAIVDGPGQYLKAAIDEGLYLIKPNLHEFQDLAGITCSDEASLVQAALVLMQRHRIEIIALSMGQDGALLISRDLVLRADGLPIEPASVSGAGDSFLGAMVWSLLNHDSLEMALRYGVAAGSAALLKHGTELCLREDVHRLAAEIKVRPVVCSV
jgi:6-phosphofructokinase 2